MSINATATFGPKDHKKLGLARGHLGQKARQPGREI